LECLQNAWNVKNVDCLKNDRKDAFKISGFSQLLNSPKSITETTAILIDVIQTNKERNISHKAVIPAGLSDYELIGCVRNMNNIKYEP